MTRRAPRLRRVAWTAVAAIAAAVLAAPAFGQPASAPRLLDVPYLPQSEDLCGGAAAAMVMRYWGARNVYADAFAPLVDHSAGGIRTSALVSALQARGWTALAEAGTADRLDQQLSLGRPVIALIEVAPHRYHYVVVLARAAGRTIVHDPARAPRRSIPDDAFDRAWQKSDRWMLTLLPPANLNRSDTAAAPALASPDAPPECAPLVQRGVAAAANDRALARSLLERASSVCPRSSAPWRELAGLETLEKNWRGAERDAERAVANDATDAYAWDLLGTARFLSGDDLSALAAWNHAGEPIVDLLGVSGLRRTRYSIVSDAAAIQPRTLLTPAALALAGRRVADVPSVAAARVSYRPVENGRAQVDVAVVERDPYPSGFPALAALGLGAAADRTLDAEFASLTGGGERIAARWRWWAHRPAIAASFIAPAPAIHGVWRADVSRETETFSGVSRETRTHFGGAAGAWMTARLHIEGTAGVDRWSGGTRQATVGGSLEYWPVTDRLSIRTEAAHWLGDAAFSTGSVRAQWRSSAHRAGTLWLARAGVAAVSDSAPALIWPGADTGHVRDVLLRAHPLLDDGVIAGGVLGRRLVSSGVEWQRWTPPSRFLVQYAPAAFIDVARAARGFALTDTQAQVDVGVGARFAAAGTGVVRIDLAHGLRDGRTALSVMWER